MNTIKCRLFAQHSAIKLLCELIQLIKRETAKVSDSRSEAVRRQAAEIQ